jgi:hypothetical protein
MTASPYPQLMGYFGTYAIFPGNIRYEASEVLNTFVGPAAFADFMKELVETLEKDAYFSERRVVLKTKTCLYILHTLRPLLHTRSFNPGFFSLQLPSGWWQNRPAC